jgi:endonuclease YncB( thermonuclease family)
MTLFLRNITRSGRRSPAGGLASLALAFGLAIGAALLCGNPEQRIEGGAQVIDGDSLRVAGLEIRLKGMDAPEMQQTCFRAGEPYRCGEVAREALIRHIAHRPLECRILGRDRYRRHLARCSVEGRDVGATLVEEGLAVGYGDYEREEARARMRSVGLWSGTFERPNVWRQSRRS